jgi:biotin carboxylase
MEGARPRVLLVGSGHPIFRQYTLRQATESADLWLLDPEPPTWQKPYLVGFTVADTFHPQEAVSAAVALAAQQHFDGVFCYHEGMIVAAAMIAEALKLPGPKPGAVTACRDKAQTRALLAEAGIAQPRYAVVGAHSTIAEVAREIPPPWVVKPRSLGASHGVIKIDDIARLEGGLAVARQARQSGMATEEEVLVEEYVEGSEVSVDGFFDGKTYTPLFLARKRLGEAPYFEETGHSVDAADELLRDPDLANFLASAHAALDMTGAITHTEVRFAASGPVLIEVNGRLGGDLIPLLAERALGVNAAWYALELAYGHYPPPPAPRTGCSSISLLTPSENCIVESVDFDAEGVREAGLEGIHFDATAQPGEELRIPPEGYAHRYAVLIADGTDPADCAQKLEAAAKFVRLAYRALA